jgi:hypothetical protein
MAMSYDVFISYAHQDKHAADAACHSLEHENIRCWIAPRDIMPGTEWGAAIIDAIDTVRIMLLVFSTSSNKSPQVRREIERAVSKGVIVLPFRIEEVMPCKTLEYFLGTQHWLDAFSKPMEPHLQTLTRTIKSILASGGEDDFSHVTHAAIPTADPSSHRGSRAPANTAAMEFDPEVLAALQARLAEYIGPMARVLVKRAAQQATSMDELMNLLAAELPTEKERATFLRQKDFA